MIATLNHHYSLLSTTSLSPSYFSVATLDHHYSITFSLLRIVLLSWCDERMMLLKTIYLFCMAWTSFHLWWPQPFSAWCRYHLPTTTCLCCMAWSQFIDVLLFVAILDHHYFSLSPSYLSITLSLSWSSLLSINVVWWTKDINTSCQQQLIYFAWHGLHLWTF